MSKQAPVGRPHHAEEINRVVTDHIADLLFCPTQTSVDNLAAEGITKGVHLVGDVMADALAYSRGIAQRKSRILEMLGLTGKAYCVLTVPGRQYDNGKTLPVLSGRSVRPVYRLCSRSIPDPEIPSGIRAPSSLPENICLIEPFGYLDMILLMESAQKILTDSGGMQRRHTCWEYLHYLRENTEWVETVEAGWNILVGLIAIKY